MYTKFLSLALSGSLVFAAQGMATDLLQDDELDRMSAAGEPTVIVSEGASESQIALSDQTEFHLNLPTDAQIGLRALTIQNVVGELQLLVNLNVLSARNSVAGTDQRNFSLQSWGSTLPDADTIKTVEGVSASANAACAVAGSCAGAAGVGGAGGSGGGASSSAAAAASGGGAGGAGGTGGAGGAGGADLSLNNQSCTSNCTATSGGGGPGGTGGAANGGNGGAAAAAAAAAAGNGGNAGNGGSADAAANKGIIKGNGAASTSPGVIAGTLGSASADVILVSKAIGNTSNCTQHGCDTTGGSSQVAFVHEPIFDLNLQSQAQRDLSALFISNVVGRAQMALNLNIASADLNLMGGNSTFAQPIDSTGPGIVKQVNTGLQFRGTPLTGATGTTTNFNTSISHLNQ